jgi:SAM-dependent methyltransferase
MTCKENLDIYINSYHEDPYIHENELMLDKFSSRCIKYSVNKNNFLELGIGHGITLAKLSKHFSRITVLEGAPKLVKQYQNIYDNIEILETYFEHFETSGRFDNIGMGFILEHVDDPSLLLRKYRNFLAENGSIFIGVPSASSLHRIIGVMIGVLDDLQRLSDVDIGFGHKRYLKYQDWIDLFKKEKLYVTRAEGLYLKPFTSEQIASLNLHPKVFDALTEIAIDYPEISNTLFFELKNEK